ncbi:MAG: hypothetical protein HFH64_00275 [Lachnospiraceae bacterium]|nr:hypothetical protein [Lachnospiraceae bacterium]
MALTHVCMWWEKSWKRISAHDAAKIFPYGTSVHSGLFMCELCGQYVTLINGSIQSSHFRHSANEKNKDCDDRSESYSYINYFQTKAHSLPIKLEVNSSKNFSLFIGFISLPEAMMRGKTNHKITISGNENFTYSFNRLNLGTITYLYIGAKPVSKYRISVEPSIDEIKSFWPLEISGINTEGTLFDKVTGKRLPYDADVQVGHTYYLLTTYFVFGNKRTVEKREVCSKTEGWKNWRIYEVRAIEFSEEAARFFLGYHCRLTDEPVTMYPIWPIYIESPYVIYYKSNQINVYFKGNAEPKLAPVGGITRYPYSNPKLLSITSTDRQQLLSAGRTDVLKYMYFWESNLDKKGEIPSVNVVDVKGNIIDAGKYSFLPNKNILCINPSVDGFVEVYKKRCLIERYELSAGSTFEYDNIRFGITINVYQGLDKVWSAGYFREKADNKDEIILLNKLKAINGKKMRTSHSIGAIADMFSNNFIVRKWLYTQIKNGELYEDAYKLISKYVNDKQRE